MNQQQNNQLFLISGYSGTGKSAALRNIPDQECWAYINTEAGKRLPFRNKFNTTNLTDPMQIFKIFEAVQKEPLAKGVIVDSLTFLMDMVESQYVINSPNTQKAWGDFAQFFKVLMQQSVASLGKPVIFTAHVLDIYDEANQVMKTHVPVKGSLKNNGIEAYFSTVVSAKKMTLKDLEGYANNLLNISEEEQELGYKHVFQTRITRKTTGERIRSPFDLFTKEQTYIDNDAALLLNHLNQYYGVNQ